MRTPAASARIAGALAAAAVTYMVLAQPAWGHPVVEDPYVLVGRSAIIALGVPSEDPAPMTEVDVSLPADFTLRQVDPAPGWTVTATTTQIRFVDGDVPQGVFQLFSFSGVFARSRVVPLAVTTRDADGAVVVWDGLSQYSPHPAPLVLPGYARGASPAGGTGASGTSRGQMLMWGGGMFVGGGAAAVIVLGRRARHRTNV